MTIYVVCAVPYEADNYRDEIIRHFINKADAQEFADVITEEYRTLVANNFQFEENCYPLAQSEAYVSEVTVY